MPDTPKHENTSQDAPYSPAIHPLMLPKERLKIWERARTTLEPRADELLTHLKATRDEWE